MKDQTDQQLLRDFTEHRSEAAFTELVRRHVDLVHSAAFRMTGNAHSAQDVTQAVFVALAQNAARLTQHPVLSGWLHTTARNLAAKNIRATVRRQTHEQEAAAMNELLSTTPDASWEEIAPHLDAALGELNESDRDAVLLRYFEKKSANEIASTLGVTAEAAQKRVNRSVERLREFFTKRGISVGVSGLAVVISANAVQAAPVGLAVTISAVALAGTVATTSTIIAATTKTVAMTTFQKTLVTATVAVVAGVGIYEARQAAQLRDQVRTLQQQQAPLSEQIHQLQAERDDATNSTSSLQQELAAARQNGSELLRLRAEVARLRNNQKVQADTNSMEQAARALLAITEAMKLRMDKSPELKIPEFQVLTPEDWFNLATQDDPKADASARSILLRARVLAKDRFAPMFARALRSFASANDGNLPMDLNQLESYFRPSIEDDALQRYRLLRTGNLKQIAVGEMIVEERAIVDDRQDSLYSIGLNDYSVRYSHGTNLTSPSSRPIPGLEAYFE